MQYTKQQILDIVNKQLLFWIKKDETVKNAILEIVNHKYPTRTETEKSIKEILQELAKDREEQAKNRAKDREEQTKKWEAQEKKWAEWNKKWEVEREENNKKYAENQKIINEILQDIRELNRKYTVNIGAIGDRWGRHSEYSFREGLRAILEESFGVKVINYEKIDKKGEVYRSPTSVEIDVIIHNGQVILCEISASFSRDDVEGFTRKIKFYEKHEKKKVSRAIIISPMIGSKAIDQAKVYSIETYTYPDKSVLKI